MRSPPGEVSGVRGVRGPADDWLDRWAWTQEQQETLLRDLVERLASLEEFVRCMAADVDLHARRTASPGYVEYPAKEWERP